MADRYRPRTVLEPDKAGTEIPKKVRGRPFQPGNPGRPPGSKNRMTRLLEQLVAGEAEKVIRKFIEMALAGDSRCMHLYIDRLLPRRNGRPVDFELPAFNDAHDIVPAMAAITAGVNDGSLTAEEAGRLVYILERYAKVLETHDLAARLAILESQMKKTP
jgi:hypothetical protein